MRILHFALILLCFGPLPKVLALNPQIFVLFDPNFRGDENQALGIRDALAENYNDRLTIATENIRLSL